MTWEQVTKFGHFAVFKVRLVPQDATLTLIRLLGSVIIAPSVNSFKARLHGFVRGRVNRTGGHGSKNPVSALIK